jgi:urea transporter
VRPGMQQKAKQIWNVFLPAVLNSYAVIFFFNNRLLGFLLLAVTFFNINAGLSGLLAVLVTVTIAAVMGYDETKLKQGLYSFNSLLTGIGMGTFFDFGIAWLVLLLLAVLFSFMISVILDGWLGKYRLPFLSIPFVLSLWLIMLPSLQFENIGLTQRNVFWLNQMYQIGGMPLINFFETIENLPLNKIVTVYLRSLSSIIFQDNLISGILIMVVLLAGSRISFLLTVTGFVTAYFFAIIVGSDMASFSFYNVGANYILVAISAGGFFLIPSRYTFLWVVILVPLTSLMILFLTKLLSVFGLPVFSLPFSVIVIAFLFFLHNRMKAGKLILTPLQHYSPEVNLYSYRNYTDRNTGAAFFPLHLPFWGKWTVYQGYNGKFTHKGEWSDALDFVLAGDSGTTYRNGGTSCSDYHCWGKPVLSPADGTIEEITDNIDDNEPGKVNSVQNWGNTIIIKHSQNLYTQLSHLRKGSFRAKRGDFVRRGDVVALCGNSGRSPEPHLHMQVQATPLIGARPHKYPVSYYFSDKVQGEILESYSTPLEGEKISGVATVTSLREAFDLQPGMIISFSYGKNDQAAQKINWEVFTDPWNNRYLYCSETESAAYFVNDGTMFYFTSFYGNRESLLYYFYLCSYRVLLGHYENLVVRDQFPLHIISKNRISLFIHDFAAPFRQFISAHYSIQPVWADSPADPQSVRFMSETGMKYFSGMRSEGTGTVVISDKRILKFSYESSKVSIWAERADT